MMKSVVVWGKRSTSLLHLLPCSISLDALRHGWGCFLVCKENGGSLWVRTSASCSGERVMPASSRKPWQQEEAGLEMGSSMSVSSARCSKEISSSAEASVW